MSRIVVSRDEVELRGFNFIREKILREYRNNELYKTLVHYADIILDYAIERAKFPLYNKLFERRDIQLRIIDLYEGKSWITEDDKYFELVKKYREYEAMTYKLHCKNDFPHEWFRGRDYFGYTHSDIITRFIKHVIEAIEQNVDYKRGRREDTPTKLNQTICLALEDMGYAIEVFYRKIRKLDIEGQYSELRKIADKLKRFYFDFIELEFHKSLKTAIEQEINLIRENDAINIGLNERGGGQGGLPFIPLPLYDIAGLCALGITQKKIVTIINRFYSRDFINDRIGENTLRRRNIEECYSWVNFQRLFLKPVIEALFYELYDRLTYSRIYSEIYYSISSKHTREGWIYLWF